MGYEDEGSKVLNMLSIESQDSRKRDLNYMRNDSFKDSESRSRFENSRREDFSQLNMGGMG